jgi:hypothetical protein
MIGAPVHYHSRRRGDGWAARKRLASRETGGQARKLRRNGVTVGAMRLLFIYLIVAVELVVATASSARTVNWGAKSALIDLGMTEQQVTKTVGSAPNKVEMETCGQHTKRGAWTCKIHTYGSGSNKLRVWFQQSPNDRMWRAVDWGP